MNFAEKRRNLTLEQTLKEREKQLVSKVLELHLSQQVVVESKAKISQLKHENGLLKEQIKYGRRPDPDNSKHVQTEGPSAESVKDLLTQVVRLEKELQQERNEKKLIESTATGKITTNEQHVKQLILENNKLKQQVKESEFVLNKYTSNEAGRKDVTETEKQHWRKQALEAQAQFHIAKRMLEEGGTADTIEQKKKNQKLEHELLMKDIELRVIQNKINLLGQDTVRKLLEMTGQDKDSIGIKEQNRHLVAENQALKEQLVQSAEINNRVENSRMNHVARLEDQIQNLNQGQLKQLADTSIDGQLRARLVMTQNQLELAEKAKDQLSSQAIIQQQSYEKMVQHYKQQISDLQRELHTKNMHLSQMERRIRLVVNGQNSYTGIQSRLSPVIQPSISQSYGKLNGISSSGKHSGQLHIPEIYDSI